MSDLDIFVAALIKSLTDRYNMYREPATPDTVLLAVLNAMHDAKLEMAERQLKPWPSPTEIT
jgi:hypothetical protein